MKRLQTRDARAQAQARARARALLGTEPPSLDRLPATEVTSDGVRYLVYGVVHGGKRFAKAADDLRTLIGQVLALDDRAGVRAAVEVGFAGVFALDPRFELPYTGRDIVDRAGMRAALGTVVRVPLDYVRTYLPTRDLELRADRRALRDVRWIPVMLEVQELVGRPATRMRTAHSEVQAEAARRLAADSGATEVHLIVGAGHVPDLRELLSRT